MQMPRHLIGHELPHLLVRAVNYRRRPPSLLLSALTCSECNVCERRLPGGYFPCASTR